MNDCLTQKDRHRVRFWNESVGVSIMGITPIPSFDGYAGGVLAMVCSPASYPVERAHEELQVSESGQHSKCTANARRLECCGQTHHTSGYRVSARPTRPQVTPCSVTLAAHCSPPRTCSCSRPYLGCSLFSCSCSSCCLCLPFFAFARLS
jgi:hypothetical protein